MNEKEQLMKEYVSRLNEASDAYYNGRTELMTDYEWDAMFDALKKLEEELGYTLEDSPTQNVSADTVTVFDQVGNVGDDQVDAQHVLLGKDGTAVHHDDILAILNDINIFADFLDTAQRDDADFGSFRHRDFLSYHVGLKGRKKSVGQT